MKVLKQKTETIEEVKENIRRANREKKASRTKCSKELNSIIAVACIIFIILILLIIIKNTTILDTVDIIEEKIYHVINSYNDLNLDVEIEPYVCDKKPVIYLYPEEETEVRVELDLDGKLKYTYPEYNTQWVVKAKPDGTLINKADNREYSYLFWEADFKSDYDMSKGFVVKGEDTAKFLQETLSKMGLTPKEYNEFIVYWLPKMRDNRYNLITFPKEEYTKKARLNVEPKPDSVLRVFMVYKPLDEEIEIEEQEIETFERKGFTLIEWGGAQIN